jgi:hypothetical protein
MDAINATDAKKSLDMESASARSVEQTHTDAINLAPGARPDRYQYVQRLARRFEREPSCSRSAADNAASSFFS